MMIRILTLLFLSFAGFLQAQETRFVTNLNDGGEGSLRSALQKNGPAKIEFKTAGYILLSSPLELSGNDILLDGANAPEGGIKLLGFGLKISGSNFDVRNLRIWVGDYFNDPKYSPDQDGILIVGIKDKPVKNGRVLNCTIFAAVDEGIATYGPVENIDIGWNMVLWGLNKSHHRDVVSNTDTSEKNHHSMAILVSEGASNIRFVQNFIGLNRHRNPRVMPGASVGFVNNLVYGWGASIDDCLYFAEKKGVDLPLKVAFLANYYRGIEGSYFGKASSSAGTLLRSFTGEQGNEFGSAFRVKNAKNYFIWDKGNEVIDANKKSKPVVSTYKEFRTDTGRQLSKSDFDGLLPSKILSAEEAQLLVLAKAGAFPKKRDKLEELIIKNFKEGKGSYINSPKDLAVGYPTE